MNAVDVDHVVQCARDEEVASIVAMAQKKADELETQSREGDALTRAVARGIAGSLRLFAESLLLGAHRGAMSSPETRERMFARLKIATGLRHIVCEAAECRNQATTFARFKEDGPVMNVCPEHARGTGRP